ncbi:toxin [Pseudomonas resinovorans]|uniref:Toxin n=1 Tax=Metapseudomonas resinovorans TaxID=53412 RepID=A0ABT4YDN7_METRE|nr:SpvB/TcaC N-terminal domain-containing protein [Pseudomonas resinovorans]MDA8486846.1 toxin [Pseudomonas resinovorans]
MNRTEQSRLSVAQPTLPKGGGAIQGMGEALGAVGMSGMASMTLSLPISPGRGYAPGLVLNYSSGAGNGAFAMGWNCAPLAIRRRTSGGVPLYTNDDTFLTPDGEDLVPERDANGQVVSATTTRYGDLELGEEYRVIRYRPCIEGGFSRFEQWSPLSGGPAFWLIRAADGQLLCLGKSAQARIADPNDPTGRIGAWLLEESVTLTGEHILYQYKDENTEGVDLSSSEATRTQTANRYLAHVQYGNVSGYAPLYAWARFSSAEAPAWLFSLVFDYGERSLDPVVPPTWEPQQPWLCREDSFSDYAFGFEVRTHRLCHQVLMFHHFPEELGQASTLVARLLLSYQQSPRLSLLLGAQRLAYESSGQVQSIPPVDYFYTPFDMNFQAQSYAALPAFPGLSDGVQYQLVDLYGEGLPGVLYQVGTDWRYQAPVRGTPGPDAITYGPWQSLSQIPALLPEEGGRQALIDITGDGRLNWLIAQPALAGFFTLNPDHSWSRFVPFAALPAEFLQPEAQLADLVGAGLSDLALIGPKSVRLYANQRWEGFAQGQDVPHNTDDRLPLASGNAAALVVFSDVLGSGQQHLVQITYNQITCWPNLGRGNFGEPIVLGALPFEQATFNPDRVYLADLDGSGATDLVYAESDRFLVFMNRSGNGFDPVPALLPMPPGVRFDQLDQVQFSDIDGSGSASLVLTRTHIQPQHWAYNFAPRKPYLLSDYNNNMGAHGSLVYRSSAQEWLDEKQADPLSVCDLPFAVQVVAQVVSLDEISGNQLTQQYLYRRGVYAGVDREFRGFGFVQHLDTNHFAHSTRQDLPYAEPTLTRVWYHTGQEGTELRSGMVRFDDPAMFRLGPPRLTWRNPQSGQDELLVAPDDATRYELYRALKGQVLHEEVYGADSSALSSVPYSVRSYRLQVRQLQKAATLKAYGVALPMALEQLSVGYQRIEADPIVQQQVLLQSDEFGAPTWSVAINYARRPQPGTNPYPPEVPDALWASTYDEAQEPLRLTEERATTYNLIEPTVWRLGLPYQLRQNVLTYEADYPCYPLTAQGLSYESLIAADGLLGPTRPRELAGQAVTYYFNAAGTQALPPGTPPPPLALMHHIETAELDEEALEVYAELPDLTARLIEAGYVERTAVLNEDEWTAPTLWVIPSGFSTYVDATGNWLPFYAPRATQSTPIVAPHHFTYDQYSCVILGVVDGLGNRVVAEYDYRFLTPRRMLDANENPQEVLLDALGRVVAQSFYGTELSESDEVVPVGFKPVAEFNPQAPACHDIGAALDDPEGAVQGAAGTYLYDLYAWMGEGPDMSVPELSSDVLSALYSHQLLDRSGRWRARAYVWARTTQALPGVPDTLRAQILASLRSPVQVAALLADQYPDEISSTRHIQITLSYSDGFGRSLQAKQKCPPGLAYVVNADGQLELSDGKPVERDTGTAPRWAVSGRVEYDNKGQPVRAYQPYFIDQPVYLNDDQAYLWGYADTHYYDPLGQEVAVVTAMGFLRRARYFPWFTIAEDENDTLEEVMAAEAVNHDIGSRL